MAKILGPSFKLVFIISCKEDKPVNQRYSRGSVNYRKSQLLIEVWV